MHGSCPIEYCNNADPRCLFREGSPLARDDRRNEERFTNLSLMKQRSARVMRESHPDDAAAARRDFAGEMGALLASADADQLAELIARANAALPDDDERKICRDDVLMLRRLAGQARTFSNSLLEHAVERRSAGDHRVSVSPEAGNTARWAERLASALETVVSRSAATQRGHK